MDCRAPYPARRHRQRYRVRTDKACRGRRLASPSGGWRARPAALRHPSTADRGDAARRDEQLTRIKPVTPETKYRRPPAAQTPAIEPPATRPPTPPDTNTHLPLPIQSPHPTPTRV